MLIYSFDNVEFSDMHIFSQSAPCPAYITQAIAEYYKAKTEIKKTGKHKGEKSA